MIDDWHIEACHRAVEGFFKEHGISPKIHDIDGQGAYFCIDKAVSVKHHVYEKFNAGRTAQEGCLTDGSMTAPCQPRLYFCDTKIGILKNT